MTRSFRTAIVLSGGGSRGAYEVGIIRYLREVLGPRMGRPVPIDILCGTSVGAINGAFMAATNDTPEDQAKIMVEAWRSLRVEEMVSLKTGDVFRAGRLLLGADPPPPKPGAYRYGGLLETSGLERFVITSIPWRRIRKNILADHVHALAVTATQVGTGHSVVFVDSHDPMPTDWSRDPYTRHRSAGIGPRHTLASAAIPLLFPSVKVGGSFFVDGGLRQNTPLSPAIRLGADRILVISLRYEGQLFKHTDTETEQEREAAYPKPLFLAGKALNALLLDHTDYDLERLKRLNAIIEAGQAAFGDEFLEVMNTEYVKLRGAPIKKIETVHIKPSRDIGGIASEFIREGKILLEGRVARSLLERLAQGEARHESDLLSYLLFDGRYAEALIDLGFEDARRQEDELAKLFF
ncbi:MAG: patatin-like phospholipase family protein [Deltaproteobacteria bacterium]|nr:patatin-like phospholipase family protein [Deltaproteobacteria bacterium]